jgi:hypothetical protein
LNANKKKIVPKGSKPAPDMSMNFAATPFVFKTNRAALPFPVVSADPEAVKLASNNKIKIDKNDSNDY